MTKRERLAGRFVADVVAGGGDRRKMSNVTKSMFSDKERAELAGMAHEALVTLVATNGARRNGFATQLGKHAPSAGALTVVLTKALTDTIRAATP